MAGKGELDANAIDKVGLIRESYRMNGLTEAECRSIFLDWALKLPDGIEPAAAIRALLDTYGGAADHPMTGVLKAGLDRPTHGGGRRGGVRRGRRTEG